MASFQQRPDGKWRALVARQGVRKSRVCETKREAQDWAAREEYLILNGEKVAAKTPFREVLQRYRREVSPTKRGEMWEAGRIKHMSADRIGGIAMDRLTTADLADWRDRRLREVAPGTVLREINLLSSVLTRARKEWGLILDNPMSNVTKPRSPRPRSRVATTDELEALAVAAGPDLGAATARAFQAFLFACETAMRAGEIVGLTWEHLDLEARVAHLPMTKNGHPRDVPLSSEAVRLIEAMPRNDPVFGITSKSLDVLWRKVRDRAGVEGITFHDSRRIGTSKLAKSLDVLELARATGHRDLSMLLNVYYHVKASDLAKKLD